MIIHQKRGKPKAIFRGNPLGLLGALKRAGGLWQLLAFWELVGFGARAAFWA